MSLGNFMRKRRQTVLGMFFSVPASDNSLSFNKYTLNMYYVPGPLLGVRDRRTRNRFEGWSPGAYSLSCAV